LLKGALLGSSATFSALIPQSGQRNRYSSITYRRAVFEARQIPYLPLVNLGNFPDPSTTAGTLQFAVPALVAYPQTHSLSFFVDLSLP
jgi:hypothetical protein